MTVNHAAATLLYVEDDALTREMVRTALSEAGFEVVIAEDGTRALAIIEDGKHVFRGLVTDVNLGRGPDGWQVARHARERLDALPVVYVSGDSGHEWASKGVPHSTLVAKPFAPAQIVVALATLMNSSDTPI